MVFRMGLHLGDIVVEQERIDGVASLTLAARLERLAEGGGLCISGTVYDHVVAKLHLDYSAIGVWVGQGISAPVRVYRVQIDSTARPFIRCARVSHTHIVWPRARRMARVVLHYLGNCAPACGRRHPTTPRAGRPAWITPDLECAAHVDNLWDKSLEKRQNLIPRKRWQRACRRPRMQNDAVASATAVPMR